MITVKNLCKTYNNKDNILDDISYTFGNNGLYVIKGYSGSGKTTFLKCLIGLLPFEKGDVFYDEKSLSNMTENEKNKIRLHHISYVPQQSIIQKYNSVNDAIKMYNATIDIKALKKSLRQIGIKSLRQKISTLSGGELIRLELLLAINKHPDLLICDEPTAGLDYKNRGHMLNYLKQISAHIPVILVSHDDVNEYINDFTLLEIKDNKLYELQKQSDIKVSDKHFKNKKEKIKSNIGHFAFLRLKNKKIRSLIMFTSLIISLSSSGYIFNFIDNFQSSIINQNMDVFSSNNFIIETKNKNDDNYKCLDEIELRKINESSSCYITSFYDCNYENLFNDENNFYYQNMLINNIGIRQINEFIYTPSLNCKTEFQIGLGLTNSNLYLLSKKIGIENSISDLKDYCKNNYLEIHLDIKNETYSYSETVNFQVIDVFNSESNYIAHSFNNFNSKILESYFGFPVTTNINEKPNYPNELKKYTITNFNSSYEAYQFEEMLNENIQTFNVNYLSNSFPNKYSYFYLKTENEILTANVLDKLSLDYIVGSNDSYLIDPNSGLAGFSGFLYLSKYEYEINEIVDKLENEDNLIHLKYKSSNNVLQGNILNTSTNNIKLGTLTQKLKHDSILVSKGLADNLNVKAGDILYFSYFINNKSVIFYLEVEEIINDNSFKIYQSPTWFYRYCRDELKLKNNIPDKSIIYFNDSSFDLNMYEQLKSKYNHYTFSNECYSRFNQLISLISIFKIVAYSIFGVLLIINIIIGVLIQKSIDVDSVDENEYFSIVGYNNKDIFKVNLIYKSIIVIGAFLYSVALIFILNVKFESLLSMFSNSISIKTIIFMIIYCLIVFLPSFLLIKEKHNYVNVKKY